MREIKFDVIILRGRDYLRPGIEHLSLEEALVGYFIDFKDGGMIPSNKSIIIREYTGLLDKQGKEIYEGDIIKNQWTDRFGGDIGVNWIIKFGEYDNFMREGGTPAIGFYAENKQGTQESPTNLGIDENGGIEIIGNIYENPELLKEVK